MQLTVERREKPSSFTGLSLVLFLFLSVLSMMAAYEAGKSTDEARSVVMVSLNEHAAQGADSEFGDETAFLEPVRARGPALLISNRQLPGAVPHGVIPRRAFDARGPPHETAAAS